MSCYLSFLGILKIRMLVRTYLIPTNCTSVGQHLYNLLFSHFMAYNISHPEEDCWHKTNIMLNHIVADYIWWLICCNVKQLQYKYLLTPWCRVLLEKLTGLQPVKKFPPFHGTRSFITALTSIRHPSLSWASPIQSIYPHPTSWRSILILSTHLHQGLPSGLFPSGFPTKTLHTPLSSPICTTCPSYSINIWYKWITKIRLKL